MLLAEDVSLARATDSIARSGKTVCVMARALRAQQQNWTTERAKLIEKNELAKSRVESMIVRLKSLEQES